MDDKDKKPAKRTFVALVGLDYMAGGKPVRVEAGKKADGIPARSIPWLIEQGLIKEAK